MSKTSMNFRMEDELVEQLKKIADHENRSLTNLIETELKKFAQNHSIIISLERGQKKKNKKEENEMTANRSGFVSGRDL